MKLHDTAFESFTSSCFSLMIWSRRDRNLSGAHVEFKVCNQTLNLYNVAIGTVVAEAEVETEGCWTLSANSCVTPVKAPLGNRYYYLYASSIHGDDALTGAVELCINTKGFIIKKIDPERPACWQRGFIQVNLQ